jgi:hypothetical protein
MDSTFASSFSKRVQKGVRRKRSQKGQKTSKRVKNVKKRENGQNRQKSLYLPVKKSPFPKCRKMIIKTLQNFILRVKKGQILLRGGVNATKNRAREISVLTEDHKTKSVDFSNTSRTPLTGHKLGYFTFPNKVRETFYKNKMMISSKKKKS